MDVLMSELFTFPYQMTRVMCNNAIWFYQWCNILQEINSIGWFRDFTEPNLCVSYGDSCKWNGIYGRPSCLYRCFISSVCIWNGIMVDHYTSCTDTLSVQNTGWIQMQETHIHTVIDWRIAIWRAVGLGWGLKWWFSVNDSSLQCGICSTTIFVNLYTRQLSVVHTKI